MHYSINVLNISIWVSAKEFIVFWMLQIIYYKNTGEHFKISSDSIEIQKLISEKASLKYPFWRKNAGLTYSLPFSCDFNTNIENNNIKVNKAFMKKVIN